jgi:hypothetical protein
VQISGVQCFQTTYAHHKQWNPPDDTVLADPQFYEPGQTDIVTVNYLLGHHEGRTRKGFPVLQSRGLRWLVAGTRQYISAQYIRRFYHCKTNTMDTGSKLLTQYVAMSYITIQY